MTATINFMRGEQRFEIAARPETQPPRWVGYLDGAPSVEAEEPHLVARALIEKHVAKRRLPDRAA